MYTRGCHAAGATLPCQPAPPASSNAPRFDFKHGILIAFSSFPSNRRGAALWLLRTHLPLCIHTCAPRHHQDRNGVVGQDDGDLDAPGGESLCSHQPRGLQPQLGGAAGTARHIAGGWLAAGGRAENTGSAGLGRGHGRRGCLVWRGVFGGVGQIWWGDPSSHMGGGLARSPQHSTPPEGPLPLLVSSLSKPNPRHQHLAGCA